jgi:hypothetical protein
MSEDEDLMRQLFYDGTIFKQWVLADDKRVPDLADK